MSGTSAPSPFYFPLAITPAPARLREPAAWFIPGSNPAHWLDEMLRWNVSLIDARLFAVPTKIGDPTPCGILVLLKESEPYRESESSRDAAPSSPLPVLRGRVREGAVLRKVSSTQPNVSAALPYARLGDTLFFPADAQLTPEISLQEAAEKLKWPVQLFHPSAGLVGFAREDALSIDALFAAPIRRSADWSRAESGPPRRPPLTSVLPQSLPTIQEILNNSRGDIGSEASDDLPRRPGESPLLDGLGTAAALTLAPLLAAMGWTLSIAAMPLDMLKGMGTSKNKGKSKPREPGEFRKWLMSRLKAIHADLEARRNRELNRLLGLMKDDPDTGLQFALPLNSIVTRGLAPPSAFLGRRSVNFNLSGLFGGNRPADLWSVPPDLQQQLQQRYREAANRELNLGRFSRAAYIFAHLLGDFTAAADALKRGGLFREAATIYKDKLNNTKAAADCLAAGGLLLEAIPLYRELHLYETAAALHERLGQDEEACACYRQAVTQFKDRRDFVSAARLLETKLTDPDAALDLLAKTWPDSDRGGVCLTEWFAMCGRLARHEEAINRVTQLGTDPLAPSYNLMLVQCLSAAAVVFPNPNVRSRAADTTRVLAGNRLVIADSVERSALVKAVVSLSREDRLLTRDGNRFVAGYKIKPAPVPIPVKGVTPAFVRSFLLPRDYKWHTVVSITGGFLALGTRTALSIVVHGLWDGRMVNSTVPVLASAKAYVLLPPPTTDSSASLVRFGSGDIFHIRPLKLPRIDVFRDELTVETPSYISPTSLAVCRAENEYTWVLSGTDPHRLALSVHARGGKLLSSHSHGFAPTEGWQPEPPLPMAARRGTVYIAAASRLIVCIPEKSQSTTIELSRPIERLVPSAPFTTTRLLASFSQGCAVVQESGDYQPIAAELEDPIATFTPDGSIVAIGGLNGQIYRGVRSDVRFLSAFEVNKPPLAVLPAASGEFALFDSDGGVSIYRLTGS